MAVMFWWRLICVPWIQLSLFPLVSHALRLEFCLLRWHFNPQIGQDSDYLCANPREQSCTVVAGTAGEQSGCKIYILSKTKIVNLPGWIQGGVKEF